MMRKPELFSEREKEVIALLLQGKSNKQIALELDISQRTVEFHLKNIYTKLQVSSRTEAILKLGKSTGIVSTGELVEATVDKGNQSSENDDHLISRRIGMKNLVYITSGLSITMLVVLLVLLNRTPTIQPLPTSTANSIPSTLSPTIVSSPTISPKEHILEQVRRLASEYEQAIQSEKQNGDVEFSTDPNTGEEIFLFKGESEQRISELSRKLDDQLFQLYQLYDQVYRDEANPTPFPTSLSPEQNQHYYDFLIDQLQELCPTKELDLNQATVMIYDPGDGKYRPWIIDDEIARCDVYAQMMEEWRTSPSLAKVNKDADMAMIRQVTGKAGLSLKFQAILGTANAPGQSSALYTDETGTEYYIDVETARLVEMIPNFQSHPNISASEKKSMDELRGIARQFASTNSPRLAELGSVLLYEENCKGAICFFRWDYRNKDWSGTDWVMMPPFLQVGVLTNGHIVTYNNTLDLFK